MNTLVYLTLCLLMILFSYIVFRVAVRRDYQKKGKLSNLATFLEFLIFGAHANLSYTFLPVPYPEIPPLPKNQIQAFLGVGMMLFGIFITLWAMSGLGFKKAFGQEIKILNRFGFYQFTRNPQIIAYGITVLGLAVLWFSLYALGWVLLYAIIAHMMVITEEEHLAAIFQEEYEDYCNEVPRYLW